MTITSEIAVWEIAVMVKKMLAWHDASVDPISKVADLASAMNTAAAPYDSISEEMKGAVQSAVDAL